MCNSNGVLYLKCRLHNFFLIKKSTRTNAKNLWPLLIDSFRKETSTINKLNEREV